MFEEHPLLITSLYFITSALITAVSLRPTVILCDNLPPDVLEHLFNNKLIITDTKAIPGDIAMGVDVDSINMSDHVAFDAPQTSDLAETTTSRLLEGIPLT